MVEKARVRGSEGEGGGARGGARMVVGRCGGGDVGGCTGRVQVGAVSCLDGRRVLPDPDRAKGVDVDVVDALEGDALQHLRLNAPREFVMRHPVNEDLVRPAELHQPGREIHGVPHDRELPPGAAADRAHQDFPGAHPEGGLQLPLQPLRQVDPAQRVVRVVGHAEDHQDGPLLLVQPAVGDHAPQVLDVLGDALDRGLRQTMRKRAAQSTRHTAKALGQVQTD